MKVNNLYFFFFLSVLAISCQNDIQTINKLTAVNTLPSETMKDADILYSDSAKVRMELKAKVLNRYPGEKPYIVMPKGVQMFFFDDSMKINSQMKSDYAIRYEKEGIMEAKKNVEVINIKGEKLKTEHLIWNETKDSIYTKAFVTITTKSEVLYGNGLESNKDFTQYRIKKVTGMITLQNDNAKNSN